MIQTSPITHSEKRPFDRDAQYRAKRRSVILSAASAFRKKGYHNTSMIEIAKSLGLTKAALYYYVRNKEEILFESHLMTYHSMDIILREDNSNHHSGLDSLEAIFRSFVGLLTQSGVPMLTDVDSLTETHKAEVLTRRNTIERSVIKRVKVGQADGSIGDGDARLYVFFFMGALNWLNTWFDENGRMNGDDIADHFVMQLRRGIASPLPQTG